MAKKKKVKKNMNRSKTITALHQHIMDKAVLKSEGKLLCDYPVVIIHCPIRKIKTTTTNKLNLNSLIQQKPIFSWLCFTWAHTGIALL